MLRSNETATLVRLSLALSLFAGVAHAQQAANPELGETGGSAQAGANTQTGVQAQGTWQPPTAAQTDASTTSDATTPLAAGTSDHAGVVGTFGIGFFGVMGVPVAGCTVGVAGAACPNGTAFEVSAPTIGLRYWLQENMGIEAALGFNITSGGTTTKPPTGASTDVNDPSYVAFALHGGLPLVFANSGHFSFEVIPELNFGLATGSLDTGAANADVDLSGFLFELGARAGAEIQFGFIGIPQLALQGTVGAHLRYEGRSATINGPGGATEISNSRFGFGTSVEGEPWDIFTGNITAIYYF